MGWSFTPLSLVVMLGGVLTFIVAAGALHNRVLLCFGQSSSATLRSSRTWWMPIDRWSPLDRDLLGRLAAATDASWTTESIASILALPGTYDATGTR